MSVIPKEEYDLNIIKRVKRLSLLIAFFAVTYVLLLKEKSTSMVVEPLTEQVEIPKTTKTELPLPISTPEKPVENENCTVPQSKLCKNEINEIAICKKDIGEVQKSLHHCATAEFLQAAELKRSINFLKTAQKDLNETKKILREKEAEYRKNISNFNAYSQLNERLFFGLEKIQIERASQNTCPNEIPFRYIKNLCTVSKICFDHKTEISQHKKGVIYFTYIDNSTDSSKFYQYDDHARPKADDKNTYKFTYITERDYVNNIAMLRLTHKLSNSFDNKPHCHQRDLFHISIFTENSERKIAHGTIQYIFNGS